MAFSLSFSESFFTGDCDIYDIKPSERPTSVLEAIASMDAYDHDNFVAMEKKLFGVDIVDYTPETFYYDVLEMVRKTDTCRDIRCPVTVYIDNDGNYTIDVYD